MTSRFLKTRVGIVGASALVALIAVSGTSAFAGPAPAGRVATISQPAAAEPTSATDTDNVQSGDQTTPDTAAETAAEANGEASGAADPAGDPNAEGPDAAGAAAENAADDTQSGAPASGASGTTGAAQTGVLTSLSTKASVATVSSKKLAVGAAAPAPTPTADPTADPAAGGTDPAAGAADPAAEAAGETTTEAANDGPGGHEDPAGQDVNHDFQGVE
jgi:hypothetical protein